MREDMRPGHEEASGRPRGENVGPGGPAEHMVYRMPRGATARRGVTNDDVTNNDVTNSEQGTSE
jgi:hypothetical protein